MGIGALNTNSARGGNFAANILFISIDYNGINLLPNVQLWIECAALAAKQHDAFYLGRQNYEEK